MARMRFWVLIVTGAFVASPCVAKADFIVIDLQSTFQVQPNAVNEFRQFTGSRDFGPSIGVQAYQFSETAGFRNLGTLGGASSTGLAINSAGDVVGESRISPTGSATHAFIWQAASGITDLGTLGGTNSSAVAINNSRQVVGVSQTAGNASLQAFRWTPTGGLIGIGTLGGQNSSATALNGSGTVVGVADTATQGISQPFRWDANSGLRALALLAGPDSTGTALSINDAGSIVGQNSRADGSLAAVLYDSTLVPRDLGTFGGSDAMATGINNRGEVIGSAQNFAAEDRAFVYDDLNGLRDLNDLIGNPQSFSLAGALSISDTGDILAFSQGQDGVRFFLLSNDTPAPPTNPIPAPAALALVLTALPIFGFRRWHRTP